MLGFSLEDSVTLSASGLTTIKGAWLNDSDAALAKGKLTSGVAAKHKPSTRSSGWGRAMLRLLFEQEHAPLNGAWVGKDLQIAL